MSIFKPFETNTVIVKKKGRKKNVHPVYKNATKKLCCGHFTTN